MRTALHENATTTPRVRSEIHASDEPASVLAERHDVSRPNIHRWAWRGNSFGAWHTPLRLQTTLTPAQETVAVELRRTHGLPLDDRLVVVVREFVNPLPTRSGLHHCLKRHGVPVLPSREVPEVASGRGLEPYEPGFVHMDLKYLPQVPDEEQRHPLFVAIDRAARWVFIGRHHTHTRSRNVS